MKNYDLMIIGPATRDINIDFDGTVNKNAGGAVTFCAPAAAAANPSVFAAVKIAEEDRDIMELMPCDSLLLPSAKTTLMRNRYFTADRERREGHCDAQSDPVMPEEIPDFHCKMYHLAGLLYGDFPNSLLESLADKGAVSIDAQGFLRHNENSDMHFHDWADKMKYLPLLSFLKTDAAEAEILTGMNDREAAARQLHAWGAKEVMVSYNTEMMVFDGNRVYTCPVKARNLSGRTGRGDTTTGAYLAMRTAGADIADALLYATACVSLKMETPGAFRGTRQDVEDYIRAFY